MGKSKHYVKKRGGSPMHINRNAHPFANSMPMANNMPMSQMPMANNMPMDQMPMANNMPMDQMPMANNMPMAQMPMANNMPMDQIPMANNMPMAHNMQMNRMDMDMPSNNNCPPCVCPPGNAEPENKPTSLKDKVMGFNNALATKPVEIIKSVKADSLAALNNKKAELSKQIIGFLQPTANAQPEINVGGRRRRTRRKRRGTKTKKGGSKTKRRGTKTKRRRHTRR